MKFEVKGAFRCGEKWMKFVKVVEAKNERFAIEKTLSLIGSNHKVKRNLIKINGVKEIE